MYVKDATLKLILCVGLEYFVCRFMFKSKFKKVSLCLRFYLLFINYATQVYKTDMRKYKESAFNVLRTLNIIMSFRL